MKLTYNNNHVRIFLIQVGKSHLVHPVRRICVSCRIQSTVNQYFCWFIRLEICFPASHRASRLEVLWIVRILPAFLTIFALNDLTDMPPAGSARHYWHISRFPSYITLYTVGTEYFWKDLQGDSRHPWESRAFYFHME